VFLIVSVFRAVSVPLTVEGAYAAFGGLFILAGVLVWLKRKPKDDND
jgi:drug/metabolite transporter superfamily protein YnfA